MGKQLDFWVLYIPQYSLNLPPGNLHFCATALTPAAIPPPSHRHSTAIPRFASASARATTSKPTSSFHPTAMAAKMLVLALILAVSTANAFLGS